MTRDELVTILLARCERREDDTYLSGIIPIEMRLVQETIERKPQLPWFLITEEAAAATTPNEDRVPEPDDFLFMDEEQSLYFLPTDSTNYKPLVKAGYDQLQEVFGDASGSPEGFAHEGSLFRLRPIPDAAYPLRFKYYAKDSWPSTGSETNKWMTIAPQVLLAETGMVIAGQYLHNDALLAKFQAQAAQAWDDLWRLNEARIHVNRSYYMGPGEGDDC